MAFCNRCCYLCACGPKRLVKWRLDYGYFDSPGRGCFLWFLFAFSCT
nr:MAG TPA: hypothetical protein [Caudoviricetes sp.]